jgi:hypothetical protein
MFRTPLSVGTPETRWPPTANPTARTGAKTPEAPQAVLELAADEPQRRCQYLRLVANRITHPKGVRDALHHHDFDVE